MERLIEFALNHWEMVSLFFILLTAVIFTEGRRGGETVSSTEATQLMNKEEALVLDVRESKEYGEGHITGSVNIPFAKVNERVSELNKHKEKPIIIVCKMGQHSGAVGKILKAKGFTNVKRLRGGLSGWQADSLPLVKA